MRSNQSSFRRPTPVFNAMPAPRPARRGIAAVEFALVCPIFLVMILGMTEMVSVLFAKNVVTTAARRGCRTATNPLSSGFSITSAITDYLQNLQDNAGATLDGAATITLLVNDAEVSTSDFFSTVQTNDKISVTVSLPYSSISLIPSNLFMSNDTVITETVVMMRQK